MGAHSGEGSQVSPCSQQTLEERIISTCFQGVACVWWEAGPQRGKEGGKVAGSRRGHWSVSLPTAGGWNPQDLLNPFSSLKHLCRCWACYRTRTPMATGQGWDAGVGALESYQTPLPALCPVRCAQPMKVDQQQGH